MKNKSILILVIALFWGCSCLHADEFDTMRQRLLDYVALGTNLTAADADVTAYVTTMDNNAKKAWDSMEKTPTTKGYLWSDYNKLTGDNNNTSSHVKYSYESLRTMALAWATPVSKYYHDASLLADIKTALTFLYSKAFNADTKYIGNWYDWRIGIPEYYGHIVTLLYDQLNETQLNYYATSVGAAVRSTTISGNLTFANQANVCQELLTLGILTKSKKDIESALSSSLKVFVEPSSLAQRKAAQTAFEKCWAVQGDYHNFGVLPKEGYYPDGTFIQHIALPYIGAYGIEQIQYAAFLAQVVNGTSYTIPSGIIDVLPDLIQRTYLPSIYKGEQMYMFMGRSVTTNQFINSTHSLVYGYLAAKYLLGDKPEQKQIMADCCEQVRASQYNYAWTFNGISPLKDKPVITEMKADLSGTPSDSVFALYYPCGDRLIHQTKRFRFGLSMSSSRIGKFESINNANTTGWYMGDGMTYIYLPTDRKSYVNYFSANINWYRLPGITVDAITRTPETNNYGLFGTPANAQDHVGGLDFLGKYSMAAMQLVGEVSNLMAKKAWFCFDDEVVCLGADIHLSADRQVESIVEGRKSKLQMYINDEERPNKKGVEVAHEGVETMFLTGTGGYWFPQKPDLKTYVSYDGYSYIYFAHGNAPADASYEYVLLPGFTKEETTQYAQDTPVFVLQNDKLAQAVLHKASGIAGINFWEAGTLYGITSDGAACVMFQQNGDYLDLSICDPTQKRTSMTIILDGEFAIRTQTPDNLASVSVADGKTVLTVNVTDRLGQSSALHLKGTLKLPSIEELLGVSNVLNDNSDTRKYINQGQLFISHKGHIYNAQGGLVK